MVGAAVAAAGWRRRTAHATATGIIAANIPDVDVVTSAAGEYASLALRRGWTHGPPAILLGALVTVGVILLWHRWRRSRDPAVPAARPGALLALALVAALTHPLLDWMNTYGIRIFMPFDRAWYYGDSLFIIDPWLWLLLGVPLFLMHSRSPKATAGWTLLAVVATAAVAGTQFVPLGARILWVVLLAAAALLRVKSRFRMTEPQKLARFAVVAGAIYVGGMVASSNAAASLVQQVAAEEGIAAQRIMIAPLPARPHGADIVIDDGTAYHFGSFGWLSSPRVRMTSGTVPRGSMDEVARAAAAYPDARDFLRWSRFPIVDVQRDGTGYAVRFTDARYVDGPGMGALTGLVVRLDAQLRPVAAP